MATQLWFLRHAEAEPHSSDDASRRLTERGERQSRVAGRALVALDVQFQAVFSSPKVRAWDTARLACEALGNEVVEHRQLYAGFDVEDALELALGFPDQRILLVGHNPDFEMVVQDLTGARVEFKKGGVAGLRMQSTTAELVALLRPRELDQIAA